MTTNWSSGISYCLGKGLFSRSCDCLPLNLYAGYWRPLDSQVPMQADERLHPAWSRNLRAGSAGKTPAGRGSSAPHLPQVHPAPSSPGAAEDLTSWRPSGAGAAKEGDLVLMRIQQSPAHGCWGKQGGTGSQGSGVGLPSFLLRADLQGRGAKGLALLCKGGGYLAQSREQLTSELSFSGFSYTREWVRPLPCL